MQKRLELSRQTAPKYYVSTDYSFVGGKYDMWTNNGNCTHYAYARSCELAKKNVKGDLASFFPDAGLWLTATMWNKGATPKPGAIGVCENHVFIVEEVYEDGTYLISQSSWHDFIFNTQIRNTKVGDVYATTSGRLLGFIYNPYVKEEETVESPYGVTTEQAIEKMAKDVISGMYGNGRTTRMNNLYKAIQTRVNELMRRN